MTFEQHKRLIIVLLMAIVLGLVLTSPKNKEEEVVPVMAEDFVIDAESDFFEETEPQSMWPIELFSADVRLEDIEAEAAYVYWLEEQEVVYEKNAQTPLPLASLTKIMTAYTALSDYDTSATVTMTLDALRQGGDQGFVDAQQLSLGEAVAFAMVTSSNDVAYAIQESVARLDNDIAGGAGRGASVNSFVKKMNEQAADIGMNDTFFVDAVGFDDSESLSGSYGSAADVSLLVAHVYENNKSTIVTPSVQSRAYRGEESFGNTNPLVLTENLLFSKTGFTDLAGGNLAVIVDTEVGPVVMVVMGSSFLGRFDDVEVLIRIFEDWVLNF